MKETIEAVAEELIRKTNKRLSNLYGVNVELAVIVAKDNKPVTPTDVIETVAETAGVTLQAIKSRSRKRELVEARQIAMTLLKSETKMTLKTIGSFFSGRDHTTVIHAINTVEDLTETDKLFRRKYEICRSRVVGLMLGQNPNKQYLRLPQPQA